MALARAHVWNAGDLLKAADLNGEFNNILINPISLISPSTGAINFNLQTHTGLIPGAISATSGSTGQALVVSTAGGVIFGNIFPAFISATSGSTGAVLTVSTAGSAIWTTSGSGGSASAGVAKNIIIFTATSTTYVPSAGTGSALVEVWGGGGGGAGANGGTNSGGAGGAGGYASRVFTVTTSWSIAITIGAAGAGGVAGSSGTSGGQTLFNSSVNPLTANGGVGGPPTVSAEAAGGTATGGTINQTGWSGQGADAITGIVPVPGADAWLGVGKGGYWRSTGTLNGGTAKGFAASGAGGSVTNGTGGSGAAGLVRVTEFA